MTREEAARVLHPDTCRKESVLMNADDWWEMYWEARRMGAEALMEMREPDPETGLMPCGCGGVATCYSTPNEIDMAFVACGGCDIRTPDMSPESAVESWNQAMMGWRGEE